MKEWKLEDDSSIYKLLPGFYNAYLISTSNGLVMFDTARKNSKNHLCRNIDRCRKREKKVDLLVLSHAHYDHCGGAKSIVDKEGCKVLISDCEKDFLLEGYCPLPRGTNSVTDSLTKMGNRHAKEHFSFEKLKIDDLVEEHYPLEELRLNIIETPGHSNGSLSLIVNDEVALVGDCMVGTPFGKLFPPFGEEKKQILESWQTLIDTACHTFLPGHGFAINRDTLEKAYIHYKKKIC